ncbi:MAG: phosphoenolpyruvate synthase [Deltaproteobacteria bacterium]|nr:phosphoenolpyruvate synthase [Deltaproteobacteria bacterium]
MITTRYEPRFRGFHDLTRWRVREILLVSTVYDAFVLEEDRALGERLTSEYLELDLRSVPRITRASTGRRALGLLARSSPDRGEDAGGEAERPRRSVRRPCDLVLCMSRLPDMAAAEFHTRLRAAHPRLPLAFLTYGALDAGLLDALAGVPGGDRAFYWHRDASLLLAIVKLVEDARNVAHDTRAGSQVILLVEDTPRFYSLLLPILYTEIFTQTRRLLSESVNEMHRILRMRARPKVLLATNLAQARQILDRYAYNTIGIVSDVRFPQEPGAEPDPEAGFVLAREARRTVPDMPVLLQSSEEGMEARVRALGLQWVDKQSGTLARDIRACLLQTFGFGDFVFRMPDGREVGRAGNLASLEQQIRRVPVESLAYHGRSNHFSTWLRARTEFRLAEALRPWKVTDWPDPEMLRTAMLDAIRAFTHSDRGGMVREYVPDLPPGGQDLLRIGSGSLGGKGRGLAFMNALLARSPVAAAHEDVDIRIPETCILCTDVFESFLEQNRLQDAVAWDLDDAAVARRFLAGAIPPRTRHLLRTLLDRFHDPLAVRSSSLLEDNQVFPFSGVYSTYLLANNHPDPEVRLFQLEDAIRLVWASMFFRTPRAFVRNTGYRLDEERMAVLVQVVAGSRRGDLWYPTFSGAARSLNVYPFPGIPPEEGAADLAVGLGTALASGERVFHFCPARPQVDPPYATAEEYAANSQSAFWAVDLSQPAAELNQAGGFSLRRLPLERAEADGVLPLVASTFVPEDGAIRDTVSVEGPRVVRFAQVLKHRSFPLPAILREFLQAGRRSFGCDVEVEFAVDLKPEARSVFHLLQVRPLEVAADPGLGGEEALSAPDLVCASTHAVGHGRWSDLYDVLVLDPERFDSLHTRDIALEIESLNRGLAAQDRPYLLIGFGRWGSRDPSLGVPVRWEQISHARVLVESDRRDLWVEPSHGSHFLQDMLAFRLGFLFVREGRAPNRVDWTFLESVRPLESTPHVHHLRFEAPLLVEIDGRSSRGVVRRPGKPRNA